MKKKELFNLYEKLYFHEIDYRDKITARIQLPLAIYISFLSVLAFMFRNVDQACKSSYFLIFIIFFIISAVLLIIGIIYFIQSFYGHTYEFLPVPDQTEKYRSELKSTYKGFKNGKKLARKYFKEYLKKYFYECSSKNAKVNDLRSRKLHKSNFYIILTTLPLETLISIDRIPVISNEGKITGHKDIAFRMC